jgi:transposase
MDTKMAKPAARRLRRTHAPEFKVQVIDACLQPEISVAGVALANGLNANYLRRWVKEHREQTAGSRDNGAVIVSRQVKALVSVRIPDTIGPSGATRTQALQFGITPIENDSIEYASI